MWSSLFLFIILMQQSILDTVISSSFELKGMSTLSRMKRIVELPPTEKTTSVPLTSEEMRELESGTESPHLYDYPEVIYKNEEIRKGEWNSNPIPKKKVRNETSTVVKDSSKSRKAKTKSSPPSPNQNSNPSTNILNIPFPNAIFG